MKNLFFALLTSLLLLLVGCDSEPVTVPVIPPSTPSPSGLEQTFIPSLIPDYDRPKQFGGYWKSARGHCDVREILIERASGQKAQDLDRDGCMDDAPFIDPYTGNSITRYQAEIDHVYPPKKAWDHGAWLWTQQRREEFYQDQSNLLAVTDRINEEKSDKGPDEWRPPARSGWCLYSMMYRDTAVKYGLLVSPLESAALREMLATCPPG